MNSSHDTTKFRILVQVEERKPCHWQSFSGRIGEDNSKYIQIMQRNVVLSELYYLSINKICPYKYKKICNISSSTQHTYQMFYAKPLTLFMRTKCFNNCQHIFWLDKQGQICRIFLRSFDWLDKQAFSQKCDWLFIKSYPTKNLWFFRRKRSLHQHSQQSEVFYGCIISSQFRVRYA